MCVAAIPLAIGATALAAGGKVLGGISASRQASYQSQVYQANATMDRTSAADALRRGEIDERNQYRKTAQIQGTQRAALAANGIQVDYGSAAMVQQDTARIGAEDAQTVRENSIREAHGYEINAFNDTAKAMAAKAQGRSAVVSSIFDAGSTILSGASQVRGLKASRAGV